MLDGYAQYKTQSLSTMTQGEILIMLYDEVSKRLLRAEMSIANEDWQVYDESLERARRIITELMHSLDMKYEISARLYRMYDFFLFKLAKATASRNVTDIAELKPLIKDLRDAFKEADKYAKI